MHLALTFTLAAEGEWQHFLDHDRKLAELVDPILNSIESGELPGQMWNNKKRFTTLRVPGRDESYLVAWENLPDERRIVRIGVVHNT
ncbi:hypothetical protein [Clavibacter michiganensis]|uniref:hypothetical protein n=1 Tax=Clavibacter michiganensis TaxID=28447 RepID=UPI0026DA78AC|nr:hypothetical protein [Clavibacter michiganensis]MDO4070544.1 hypothetical protein [Clavibacter michiganensis]